MNNTNLDQTLADLNKIIKDLAEAAHQPVAQEVTQFLEFRAKKGEDNYGKVSSGAVKVTQNNLFIMLVPTDSFHQKVSI